MLPKDSWNLCTSFCSKFLSSNSSIQFQDKHHVSRNRRIAASLDGNSVPTLTPLQQDNVKKPRKQRVAAIVGGIGAALIVVCFLVLMYICLMRIKRSIRQTSEGESSVPSPSGKLTFVIIQQNRILIMNFSIDWYGRVKWNDVSSAYACR